ncbi:J domain-containing protein [Endozoicomonas sp. SESOKO1]|uniref:J domain-containing protein n=1 Tax=Endozoicomonas sp. SESOKO1 TaxID=2828742 RepID=UPI002148AE12|nr:J domain-containing protein [Endozoicomonas sp. SESOKO1]
MPKIESTKRGIPSSFQTIEEEPVKKAPKKEMAGSFSTGNTAGNLKSSSFKYCRCIFERNVTVSNQHPTISFNKEKVPVSDEQHILKTNYSEQTIFSTTESSSETESNATSSESSSETESSAETSERSSKADSTSSISYIQVNRLSLAQLLDRFNLLLSKHQDLLPFQIMGIPSSNEFKRGYVKLLLQIHPDKAGSKYEELFKSIFPICQELLARL